jgi:hypothetical protein
MRATTSGSAGAEGDTSPLMPHTTGKRYAVVSCHVERPLDDEVWARFSELQERKPGGFRIAALMRPADTATGEDESRWVERAREAAARGPLGHHTHWTAPDHARPTSGGTGERVLAEGSRLRELGLEPTLFCGGGWYTDVGVAEACAELGYVDCTPRATRPPYLDSREPWAALSWPAKVRLPSERLLRAIPTTHSLGDLFRDLRLLRPQPVRRLPRRVTPRTRGDFPDFVHVYFHDADLAERRRRIGVVALLRLLGRVAQPTDLNALASSVFTDAPEIPWADVARHVETQDRGQAEA